MTAIKILLEEHRLLLQAVATTRNIQKILDDETYYKEIRAVILFFRNFTDIYHHPKEDNIFYPLLRERSLAISSEFLNEISGNHDDFKMMIADIETSYLEFHYCELRKATDVYIKALEEHIMRENEIVLRVVGNLISAEDQEVLFKEFEKFDETHRYKEELISDFLKIEILNEKV